MLELLKILQICQIVDNDNNNCITTIPKPFLYACPENPTIGGTLDRMLSTIYNILQ